MATSWLLVLVMLSGEPTVAYVGALSHCKWEAQRAVAKDAKTAICVSPAGKAWVTHRKVK